MTEPANYQAAIDALTRVCVGLANVTRFGRDPLTRGHVELHLVDTADASLHPASREELYEQAMMYFADRLAEMRGSTAKTDQPTPRDRVIAVARKIRREDYRRRGYARGRLDLADGNLFLELEAAVDALEGK